jgi:hypothetical protein
MNILKERMINMNRVDLLNNSYGEIDNFRDKLGETFFDTFMEDDNYTYEIAKGIINVFSCCKTESEVEIADKMLIAICGYCLETLINRIKARDKDDWCWESC